MSDPSNTVELAPLINAFAPFIASAVIAVVGGLVTWILALLQRLTGIKLDAAYTDVVRKAAEQEAGILVARAENNLATGSVTTNSPMINMATNHIVQAMPDILKKSGISPDDVARAVTAEIGKLQAQMTVAPPGAITQPIGKAN